MSRGEREIDQSSRMRGMRFDEIYRPFTLPDGVPEEAGVWGEYYRGGSVDLTVSYGKNGVRAGIYGATKPDDQVTADGYANIAVPQGNQIEVDEIVNLCGDAKGAGRGTFVGYQAIMGVAAALLEQDRGLDQIQVDVVLPEGCEGVVWTRLQVMLGLVGGKGVLERGMVESRFQGRPA